MGSQSINFMFSPIEDGLIPFNIREDLPPKYYSAIQNWSMCFLTSRGSRIADPDYGTLFLQLVKSRSLYTREEVVTEFSNASIHSLKYCVPKDNETISVSHAWLTDLDVITDEVNKKFILYIAFIFSDGTETRTFIEA